jgi:hypothetical protein
MPQRDQAASCWSPQLRHSETPLCHDLAISLPVMKSPGISTLNSRLIVSRGIGECRISPQRA